MRLIVKGDLNPMRLTFTYDWFCNILLLLAQTWLKDVKSDFLVSRHRFFRDINLSISGMTVFFATITGRFYLPCRPVPACDATRDGVLLYMEAGFVQLLMVCTTRKNGFPFWHEMCKKLEMMPRCDDCLFAFSLPIPIFRLYEMLMPSILALISRWTK